MNSSSAPYLNSCGNHETGTHGNIIRKLACKSKILFFV